MHVFWKILVEVTFMPEISLKYAQNIYDWSITKIY